MSNPEEVAPRASLIAFPKTKPGPESFLTATLTHPRASTGKAGGWYARETQIYEDHRE